MNKNLAKVTSSVLETRNGREKAGMEMVKIGTGGLALWMLAGFIPFITLPMILVAMVVGGFFL